MAVILLILLAWFGMELIMSGGLAGLAERVLGEAQAAWPFAVVMSCRRPVRVSAVVPASSLTLGVRANTVLTDVTTDFRAGRITALLASQFGQVDAAGLGDLAGSSADALLMP